MGTKTVGIDDEAYEPLKAEKREDESFSDTVKRIAREVSEDWRRGFGKYSEERDKIDILTRVNAGESRA